jgi:hypothetical protein
VSSEITVEVILCKYSRRRVHAIHSATSGGRGARRCRWPARPARGSYSLGNTLQVVLCKLSAKCYPKGCAAPGSVQCQCHARGPLSKLERAPPQRKINVTSKSPVGDISVVTLIRTDTTLDHSQKAEKVCRKIARMLDADAMTRCSDSFQRMNLDLMRCHNGQGSAHLSNLCRSARLAVVCDPSSVQ